MLIRTTVLGLLLLPLAVWAQPANDDSGQPPAPQPPATVADAAAMRERLPQGWQQQLSAPVYVHLEHGPSLPARLLGVDNGALHLRLLDQRGGSGEAEIPLERIHRIDFPWQSLWQAIDDAAPAAPLTAYLGRKALYFEYEKALPFIDATAARHLTQLAEEATQASGQSEWLFALRVARASAQALASKHNPANTFTHVREAPALRSRLADSELLALWQLGLKDEALALARQRMPANPLAIFTEQASSAPLYQPHFAPPHSALPYSALPYSALPYSALPYALLAAEALQRGDSERALELALIPILFSEHTATGKNASHLQSAYAVAIAAAEERGDILQAGRLRAHAAANHLALPTAPPL